MDRLWALGVNLAAEVRAKVEGRCGVGDANMVAWPLLKRC